MRRWLRDWQRPGGEPGLGRRESLVPGELLLSFLVSYLIYLGEVHSAEKMPKSTGRGFQALGRLHERPIQAHSGGDRPGKGPLGNRGSKFIFFCFHSGIVLTGFVVLPILTRLSRGRLGLVVKGSLQTPEQQRYGTGLG